MLSFLPPHFRLNCVSKQLVTSSPKTFVIMVLNKWKYDTMATLKINLTDHIIVCIDSLEISHHTPNPINFPVSP